MSDELVDLTKQEELRKKEARKRERELSDIRVVIKTVEGRRLLWRVLSETGLFKDTYIHGDAGYGTTRNVGRVSIGQWMLYELMAARPEAFVQMQNEYASEVKREENEKEEIIQEDNILETSA